MTSRKDFDYPPRMNWLAMQVNHRVVGIAKFGRRGLKLALLRSRVKDLEPGGYQDSRTQKAGRVQGYAAALNCVVDDDS